MSIADKKPVDWELAERHYRAGILSLRQIAEECGVTEGAIRKRAKKDQWTRNLAEKIKHRAEELVRKAAVRKVSTQLTPASEKEVVEANAQATAIILIAQKGSISRMHGMFANLMAELEATTDNKDLFAQLGEMLNETGEDANGRVVVDRLNEIYRKVISMGGRIDSAKKLAEILEKVVKMEREAFGVDNAEDKSKSSIDDLLAKMRGIE